MARNKIILLLAANPKGTASLRLQEEEREIRERLRLAGYGKIPIYSTGATRTRDIQQAMLDFNPQVVHFCGHGTGQVGLVFEDITGQEKLVSSEALAGLFRLFADRVECVILNACSSEVQAQAISQYINYVIGMSQSIRDEAAIEFAVGFYAALGAGRTYEFAYEMGCNAILLAGIQENLTPILLKKSTLKEKLNLTTQAESTNKLDRPSTTSAFNRSGEELRNQIADKSIEVNSSLNNEVKFELNQQILDAQMQGLLTLIQQNNDVSSQAITAQLNFITSIFEFEVVTVDAQGKEINRCQKQAHCFTKDLSNGVILEMVAIPGGTFWMGSQEPEVRRYPNEGPQHLVSVKPFLISKYPITQAQWEAVAYLPIVYQKLEPCPSRFQEKNRPVEQVSWHDAVEFCARLSEKTGHEFRLPTEAEWEYACRAGSKTPFHFGETITPDLANYDGEYIYRSGPKGINRKETTIVGSFQVANAFGLFDMHGLVWEWCLDHWHESYENAPTDGNAWLNSSDNQERVIRGGSWRNEPLLCRSAYRRLGNANQMLYNVGFRVVCTLQLNLESKS